MKPPATELKGALRRGRHATVPLLPAAVVLIAWWISLAPERAAESFAQSVTGANIRFAAIGDYGWEGQAPADVARLVASWKPDLVITMGDNNYDEGAASTIDANIGQYYHNYIAPYKGGYGLGAETNRFFPSLGNHDWDTPHAKPYLDYFTLPGNERYYEFVEGSVHFFVVDSDPREPDGITAASVQANWLRERLAAAHEPWKLVYFHHPAYSSGLHGSTAELQWPFAEWGASAIMSGHDHDYERLNVGGLPYFVDGLGGRSIYGFIGHTEGSVVRYSGDYGAMLVEASDMNMTYKFITRQGKTIDTYVQCLVWEWHPGDKGCLTAGNGGRVR